MPSQTHSTLDSGLSTSASDDEVLVRVEGVSKKFCRSLKKSLWYGVCDIASELNPFARNTGQSTANKNLTTEDTESTEGGAGLCLSGQAGATFSNPTTSGLAVDSQNTSLARAASNPCSSGEKALDSTHGLRAGEFWAVRDVSFELRRGECLGLIGHNGAGKTTLLKMLNGLIKPDAGSITMRGRVGALIALGAGFNPILTGRENIYINGSVLGLTKKEIDEKIDEIIDFAEIRDAIDMPVQNYSSGMSVRLGFAVATTLEPDILILDEVLAVGDASFRAKCYKRIGELQDRAAVIFVSHSMEQMSRVASIALVLDYGKVNFLGDLAKGIELYEAKSAYFDDQQVGFLKYTEEISDGELTLVQSDINWGDTLAFNITIISNVAIQDLTITGVIYDSTNQISLSFVNPDDKTLEVKKGFNKLSVTAADITLANGIYKIGLVINKKSNIKHIFWSYKQIKFTIKNAPRGLSINRKNCEVDFLSK